MEGQLQIVLQEKLASGLAATPPSLTRREIRLPGLPDMAVAVIGMRRSGKTSFLWQCLADRLAEGSPREALVFLNFENGRLAGMNAAGLSFLLEEYFRLHPALRTDQPNRGRSRPLPLPPRQKPRLFPSICVRPLSLSGTP